MNIQYRYRNHYYFVHDGIYLRPIQTVSLPLVFYRNNDTRYTLILHDPDAVGGNKIHWLVINIPGNRVDKGESILQYEGPHPPRGSGIHRYCFLLLEQMNGKIILDHPWFLTRYRYISMKTLLEALNGNNLHLVALQYFTSSYSLPQMQPQQAR